ncbi:MAG: bifunctional 2-polyprenyl-6-hydroxyphenol methylase/3-demethylubiquinol 3-O-methyltransferase UbiG, partial [Neisseriaceae bacterium]|nr:bifunctional 2-polyprenyl-6-hydroxyphenol methylase/3-demethylubiquinol 3-O-methyltransferase UbiG [Neisseriaceae bacterium]
SMAEKGADVLGVDLADKSLKVAQLHSLESGVAVQYRKISVEILAQELPAHFDVVTCMEMLEHVPDPASVIRACADLVQAEGYVFFSTLNRNFKSYLFAVLGAEYVLNLLPKGTHDYARFITPAELARMIRAAGLEIVELKGLSYNPLSKVYRLGDNIDVNYLVAARKPA